MRKLFLYGALFCSSMLTSCFKDEPLNSEADILMVSVDTSEESIKNLFYNVTDATIQVFYDDNEVTFVVKDGADVSALAPEFVITDGATISPASGTVIDFSHGPVNYTVTSQDGAYKRTYAVSFQPDAFSPYQSLDNPKLLTQGSGQMEKKWYAWDGLETANAGFSFVGSSDPTGYPTLASEDGYQGGCAVLRTVNTGTWGAMTGKRIAAGNLFLGRFDTTKALLQTLKATQFGLPISREPASFSCWYKYKPGPTMTDRNGVELPGEIDKCAIYAVVYLNHNDNGEPFFLDGETIMSETVKNRVGVARIKGDLPAADTWTELKLDFEYWEGLDPVILEKRGYSLAFIASASSEGDYFKGAVGSELWIDEIHFNFK